MKTVQTAGPGVIEVVQVERPVPGPRDVLMRVRACGICGTDATFVHLGGMPAGPDGQTRPIFLGHEPAGEIIEAGAAVTGLKPGDQVVVNPADKAVVFGAGPIGLGVTIWLKLAGVAHVAVADVIPARLISHRIPFADVHHAFQLALTPGAAEKVTVAAGE
jgi:threonine dehydrogenase-like Zn-dependent dehydrogenase